MITRLFRNKQRLDSRDAADRLAAIEALPEQDALAAQPALIELCRQDPDPAVRQAALMRVTDSACLVEWLEEAERRDAVMDRITALIAQGGGSDLADHPRVLVARLAVSADPAIAIVLENTGRQGLLIDAVLSAQRSMRADVLELPAFWNAELLHELERRSRDHDKTTNRIARSRLEQIKGAAAEAQALTTSLTERLESLERQLDSPDPAEHKRRQALLVQMQKDLSLLTERSAELARAGTPLAALGELTDRCNRLVQQAANSPGPDESNRGVSDPARDTTTSEATDAADFTELAQGFQALNDALDRSADFEALAAERQALTERWLAAADHAPPTDAQHRLFEQVSHRFQTVAEAHQRLQAGNLPRLPLAGLAADPATGREGTSWREIATLEKNLTRLRKGLTALNWPEWAPVPERLALHQSEAAAAEALLSAWQAHQAQTLTELEEQLERLDGHLEAGDLQAARSDAASIRKRLQALPDRAAAPLSRHLGRASARLAELSDWQTFATTPKRESLLRAMQEIADTPLAARDQAQRIKDLRNQWNALGPVGRTDDHKLMEAFNETAERAFEPCRSYFAEQAELRAENLAARAAICDSLSQYVAATDWPNADFKAAERILRTARDEWRRCHPVDRTPGKAQEARFEALQAELHGHIQAEWDRNLATKQQIVAEAQTLAASDTEVHDKVAAAKRLQQQWKAVGATPRRPDQSLWRRFRAACDEIFNTLDEARKSADEEIKTAQQQADELLAEFRSRIDAAADTLDAAADTLDAAADTLDAAADTLDAAADTLDAAALRDVQQRFDDLPALPDRLARPLRRELDELLKAAQQVLRDQHSAQTLSRLEGLKQQDAEVSAIEQRQMAGERLPFSPPDPFFAGRGAVESSQPLDAETLTRLTIEAEIAAGLESKETDLRMSIQVEMMNAGRGREALEASAEELAGRWCRLGPKNADADALGERFFAALGRLNER